MDAPGDALDALADAAGGALAAAAQTPSHLPTPRSSAISVFADTEGILCNVGVVADVGGFVVRAVALEPGGAAKTISDAGPADAFVYSLETP